MTSTRIARLAALALAGVAAPAAARPFTVGDYLHEAAFGSLALDPGGRWLAIERLAPYDTGRRYDYGFQTGMALSHLYLEDLAHPGPAKALLKASAVAGDVIGGFSPSGRRLAVLRVRGNRLTLGVAGLPAGAVRWFAVTPQIPEVGRSLQWISDTELLVSNRPDGSQPWLLREGHVSRDELPRRWAAMARGTGAWTVLGSGSHRDARARPPADQLLRLDVVSGRRTVLAAGETLDLEASPDGRHVAVLTRGADIQPEADQPLHGDWGVETQRTDLALVDLTTRAVSHPCPGCDLLPQVASWSPDGGSLLIYARAAGLPWSAGQFRRIDVATGRVEVVGGGLAPLIEGRPEIIRTGWMGQDPIVFARPANVPTARLDWHRLSPDGPVNLTSQLSAAPKTLVALDATGLVGVVDHHLWRVDRTGGALQLDARAVEDGGLRANTTSRRPDIVPPRASWVFHRAAEGRRQPLRVDAAGRIRTLDVDVMDDEVMAISDGQSEAVSRTSDGRGPAELRLRRRDAAPVTISAVNSELAGIDAPDIRALKHKGPDGQEVTSWLFLPRLEAGARPPPLVVRAYPGDVHGAPPRDGPPPHGTYANVSLLVGHGYAVLVPSLPAPRSRGEPSAGLADRILAIVDQAAADPLLAGTFDPDRLAIWGHSFGGYAVEAVVGQTERFRAGVALSASNDVIARWGAFSSPYRVDSEAGVITQWSAGATEFLQLGMGAPPWKDVDRYIRSSPLLAADRIRTPLMLVAGDQDVAQPGQAEGLFSALYRQNRDALLVTYWGEGHILTSPGNVRDFWTRAFAFLDGAFNVPSGSRATPRDYPGPASASGAPRPPSSPR